MPNELIDRQEAHRDAILIRAGARKLNFPGMHPEAAGLLDRGENLLKGLALACGLPVARGASSPGAVLARGLTSSDFKAALSSIVKVVSVHALADHAGHRQFCKTIELQDFKSREFPSVDADFAFIEAGEMAEFPFGLAASTNGGLSAGVRTFGRNVQISREVLINDDVGLITGLFANAGASASRLEAEAAYGLLESNPVLGDGQPMFDAAFENVEAAHLDESSAGAAIGKLRTARTPAGSLANHAAAFLIVAPGLELSARKMVHQCSLNLEVIASAWLPSGRWYLSADPALAACLGLLHLRGSAGGLLIGPRAERTEFEGVSVGVRFDFGVVPMGRVGIVRGGL